MWNKRKIKVGLMRKTTRKDVFTYQCFYFFYCGYCKRSVLFFYRDAGIVPDSFGSVSSSEGEREARHEYGHIKHSLVQGNGLISWNVGKRTSFVSVNMLAAGLEFFSYF